MVLSVPRLALTLATFQLLNYDLMTDNPLPSTAVRTGYTLPVFACASAIAALQHLQDAAQSPDTVPVALLEPDETATIAIEQVASLPDGAALAVSRSDPGDNLDLTRHTPVWAVVAWATADQPEPIRLAGGEGIGRNLNADGAASISRYARRLLLANLQPYLRDGQRIVVTIVLPQGRSLAQRTSNAAFGVVEGLSLLGTSGISQPLSAPGQLEQFRHSLRQKAEKYASLVFCVGENGLDRALREGFEADQRVKTANWLGPMLVEAALCGVESILLLGYHGKLLKLAGGIFHTHHYVADGRQEVLAAHAAAQGLPSPDVQTLLSAQTVEAGLAHLRQLDTDQGTDWADRTYRALVEKIDARSRAYIYAHSEKTLTVGTALFDRDRVLFAVSESGRSLLTSI